jgi:hypothetical protein
MGLDKNGSRFILSCKEELNVSLDCVATIGRQDLHTNKKDLSAILDSFYLQYDEEKLDSIIKNKFCEKYLEFIGAGSVESFDNSDFEKATYIHDFNIPIPESFHNRYSLVIDGGSLEHIFNFPIAISNCMKMTKENGYIIIITPSNGYFGHGFYQFSSELFYRVFSEENGFKIIKAIKYEEHDSVWKNVPDGKDVGRRITLDSLNPTYLLILAQKEKIKNIFEKAPQQSDYSLQWIQAKGKGK